MPLNFTKMHGLGNDYVYISTFDQTVPDARKLAKAVSDRHRGIGSDGLILVAPPEGGDAHCRMEMYNADGSRSQMCGNGIRCVAKFAYERGLARRSPMRVATDAGVLTLDLTLDAAGKVEQVRVDMGEPVLDPKKIPVALGGERIVGTMMPLMDQMLALTAVSMGNPHAVFFTDDIRRVPLQTWGPQLERHPLFPQRINAHFVQVVKKDFVKMITWERGSGATQACGTGASAVCVAGVLNRKTDRTITAQLPGGNLKLEWDEASNHVFMTGPATEVFNGVWPA
ncbi:Diaminopimelate epimerase [Phycisphaerae bacterium RAS1]|nr:Diaminopimelate epimerase [Phycisphaerae bacterium RAS1]